MLERLATEEQLSKYAGWFIPLKIEASGEAWSQWRSKYPYDGNTIPIVFVIRADGEKLYGKSGSLPGMELYQLLNSSLSNAGTLLDPGQLAMIERIVAKTEQLVEQDETEAAVKQLVKISKFGVLGQIGCHAEIAVKADALANDLAAEAMNAIAKAEERMADSEQRFDGLVDVLMCAETYGRLPTVNKKMKQLRTQWGRDKDLKLIVKQAKQYQRLLQQLAKGKLSRKIDLIREFANRNAEDERMMSRAVSLVDRVARPDFEQLKSELVTWVATTGDNIEGSLGVKHESDGLISIQSKDGKPKKVKLEMLEPISRAMAMISSDEG